VVKYVNRNVDFYSSGSEPFTIHGLFKRQWIFQRSVTCRSYTAQYKAQYVSRNRIITSKPKHIYLHIMIINI
jgi:hypothetical protein